MSGPAEPPLILGGHTFVSQLGNDPPASEREQRGIVQACLDHGIRWFDTTYQPERVALGSALEALGRRGEAALLAWNFFTSFGSAGPVGGPEPYRPGHIDVILEQLRADRVDCLVAVLPDDPDESRRQLELLAEWQRKGYARSLGIWVPDAATIERHRGESRIRYAVSPFNVATPGAAALFSACKAAGWETLATSPFHRGWELERILARACERDRGAAETLRPVLADLMLRFCLFQPDVDRLIVAMRKTEWVARNLESVARGPLGADERRRLEELYRAADEPRPWWKRLLRRS